jgi:hypothetical protein
VMGQLAGNFAAKVAARVSRDEVPVVSERAGSEALAPVAPVQPARELNALALLWAMIAGFFKGLFGRKPPKSAS